MNTKTMEGLAGARTNMNQLNTPMRVYKEARRKGDTATMERSMGYVCEFADKAEEYKAKADKGMEEDVKEAREKAKLEREEAIQKRKEEREKLKECTQENRNADINTDMGEIRAFFLKIREEGKGLLKDNADADSINSAEQKTDTAKEPVIYTKSGEAVPVKQDASISVSV